MGEICTDNRLELIQKYKEKLIQETNIETAKEEMAVIDNILFRFWQMGWLEALEKQIPTKPVEKDNGIDYNCPVCGRYIGYIDAMVWETPKYCDECGHKLDWRSK